MKTALITGASGGIGSAIVKTFLQKGYFVIGQYNKGEEQIEALKQQVLELGFSDYFFAIKADFNSVEQTENLYKNLSKSFKSSPLTPACPSITKSIRSTSFAVPFAVLCIKEFNAPPAL